MSNILESALNAIQGLIPQQKTYIITREIQENKGFASSEKETKHLAYAHIQPITPFEMKKVTDFTLDSVECYKLFYTHSKGHILNSISDNQLSLIEWDNKLLKAYAVKRWQQWSVIYATISKTQKELKNGRDL